jgi:hypothetical protein
MKIQCLLLASLAAQAAGFDILAALHGHGKKKHHHGKKGMAASDPTGIMGQIMAATSAGLADAEKAHDKAVKGARDHLQILLQQQVVVLSDAVKKLDADLVASATGFETAKDAAQKALDVAAANKTSEGGNSWDLSPSQLQQAKLVTKIGSADTALKKAERKRARAVNEAVSRCDSLLEEDDSMRKLTRKVGDTTQLLKDEVAPLDEVGKALTEEVAAKNTSLLQKGAQALDMTKAAANLATAKSQLDKSVAAAQKSFDATYDKVAKEYSASLKELTKGLDQEQAKEIQTVRGAASSIKIPEVKKKAVVAVAKNLRGEKNATAKVMTKNATKTVTKNATVTVATNATKKA